MYWLWTSCQDKLVGESASIFRWCDIIIVFICDNKQITHQCQPQTFYYIVNRYLTKKKLKLFFSLMTLVLTSATITELNHISDVMVSMFTSSVVDQRFEHPSEQKKDYKINIFFSAKHASLRSKSKDWLVEIQDNMSEWSNLSTHGLLFRWVSIIKIQLGLLVRYQMDIISSNVTCSWHDIAEQLLI